MRWEKGKRSDNVEDRRGAKVAAVAGVPIGCGTIVVGLLFLALGGDPQVLLQVLAENPGNTSSGPSVARGPQEDQLADFVSVVLADTEQVWTEQFSALGKRYRKPKLVLFTDQVQSACGFNSAATGPFYCPADQKAYIDLSFYHDLSERFGAPGDFAQAYVLAHEIGHHVQNLLGINEEVHERQRRARSKAEANQWSVRLELQADCFAGIWAHHAQAKRQLLEDGDVKEGLTAAAAIGDDRLQMQSSGRIVPESWTHGSSKQRVTWFYRGMESGDLADCDTFQ